MECEKYGEKKTKNPEFWDFGVGIKYGIEEFRSLHSKIQKSGLILNEDHVLNYKNSNQDKFYPKILLIRSI